MITQKKGMTGKDIITVGIFSAIYFVINFAFASQRSASPALDLDAWPDRRICGYPIPDDVY